ncbi:alpha/beta fold hydrolase [Crocinitomix catalasitica]|uniref:alpha/beta fold hydrolase n=1 Tax=Crocinitomix catalasitica TaxID=184607 RepID=UPI00146FB89E|nr:alpha/beta hydrolase [Crocinitomix catalasitica]
MSKLSLLLFIPFIACMNTNNKNAQADDIKTKGKIETDKTVAFNTLIKGTGSPTIIFESGLGTPLNNWESIQTSISKNYKTIAYDRRGIGQSPATDNPRTIENLVKDLDILISQNNIDGPIILVGHSLGGHIVRKYQQSFPSKVAGLFLIDPTNEYIYEEVFNHMSPESADSMKTAWDTSYKKGTIGVFNEWKEAYNIDQIMRMYPLPTDIPITILASYQASTFLTKQNAKIKEKQFSDWKKNKPNVKILNTTNSGHYIHLGEPEWVITELEAYLKNLK